MFVFETIREHEDLIHLKNVNDIIASFKYNEDEDYWYLRTYGNFNANVDWYDFGCLVKLGYKWIKDGCFNDNLEVLGGEYE